MLRLNQEIKQQISKFSFLFSLSLNQKKPGQPTGLFLWRFVYVFHNSCKQERNICIKKQVKTAFSHKENIKKFELPVLISKSEC